MIIVVSLVNCDNSASPSYCSLTIIVYPYKAIGLGQNEVSSTKFRSHSASSPTLSKAMNSDSIVERAIHVLDDFQDIAPPPIVKTYQLVNFVSVDPVIKFISLYPSRTAGYLL